MRLGRSHPCFHLAARQADQLMVGTATSSCAACASFFLAVFVCDPMQLLQRLEGRVGEPVTVQLPALAQVGGSGQG